MAVRVGGEAAKQNKPIPRWYGELEIAKGAWNAWLRSKDWSGMGRVVLALDHMELGLQTLAATNNSTLVFRKKEVGSEEWLAFDAEIKTGEWPKASAAQNDAAALIDQRLLTDVSVGLVLLDYRWELERDPDNERAEDTLVCIKAAMRELSVVTFGAMREDGNIAIVKDEMADSPATGETETETETVIRLEAGPMREYLQRPNGDVTPMTSNDIQVSKAEAVIELNEKIAASTAERIDSDRVTAMRSRLT